MKITFILKNKTEEFYTGGMLGPGLLNMADQEKWDKLNSLVADNFATKKIGLHDSFPDKIELNQIMRTNQFDWNFKLESRRGYKLVTFDIVKRQ